MNTTVIQIKWKGTDDYYEAIRFVSNTPLNTFEVENIKVTTLFDSSEQYTQQRQLTAMIKLGCCNHNRVFDIKCKRGLVWYYIREKFGRKVSLRTIGEVSNHDHASVHHAFMSISNLLKHKDVQRIKDEVYQVCDQIFV